MDSLRITAGKQLNNTLVLGMHVPLYLRERGDLTVLGLSRDQSCHKQMLT